MSNTIKTLSDGDLVREYLASFHNNLKFIKTINREYDARFAKEGAKNGGSLLIKNPNEYVVTTGAVMDTQDVTESTQTLTVATQKHISAPPLTSVEMTMSVDDFRKMFIDPAMSRLAAQVEYDVMNGVYKNIWNFTGTAATTPASLTAILNANARLSQGLAPENDRHVIMNSVAMAATVASMSTYFHKASEIERAFAKGYVGEAANMKWWESNMVPNHTNGARVDASHVCNTSTGITSGSANITTTGQTSTTNAFLIGDVITIADVYAVNPETKQRYPHLQQFVITADKTCDTTDVLAVSPTPVTSGAKQNVEIVSAGAGKAVVSVAAGGSGAASTVYTQHLAYHKDAFTFVSADLHMEPGERMTRAVIEGISMRLWRASDIINDKHLCRIDVLYGFKALRPEWAVRVRG